MANPIPAPLALDLSTIANGDTADATPVESSLAAIITGLNLVLTALRGGSAGQLLQSSDGTDIQWGDTSSALLIGKMLGMATVNAVVVAGTLATAGAGSVRIQTADGSSVANVTGGSTATSSQIVFLWNACGSTVTFVTGGSSGSALRTGFSLENNHGALLLFETNTQSWIRLGTDDPASTAATLAQVFAGGVKSKHPSQGVGYATGAGAAVTQVTDRSTLVSINAICGNITTAANNLANGATVTFAVVNSAVAAGDVVIVNWGGLGAQGPSPLWINGVSNGSFTINYTNNTGLLQNTAFGINFAVIKAVSA